MHQKLRNYAPLSYAGYLNGTPVMIFDTGTELPMWVMPTEDQFEYMKDLAGWYKFN